MGTVPGHRPTSIAARPENVGRLPETVEHPRGRSAAEAAVASWELPNEPAAVPTARHLVSRQLREWGLEHLVTKMELIVSELVTNAVHHGDGPSRIRLIRHHLLASGSHKLA
ncbi:ATP-binding protein [Streptomyces mirabilis]